MKKTWVFIRPPIVMKMGSLTVADASWLSLHLRKYALAKHYLLSLAW